MYACVTLRYDGIVFTVERGENNQKMDGLRVGNGVVIDTQRSINFAEHISVEYTCLLCSHIAVGPGTRVWGGSFL